MKRRTTRIEAGCPKCGSIHYYHIGDWQGHMRTKPEFRCGNCNHHWLSGESGKPYIDFARKGPNGWSGKP